MNDLYDAIEALDAEDDEALFSEDDEADDEARRNGNTPSRFRQPVRTGGTGGYYRPRPATGSTQYVTQPQLQAALARVSADVKTNAEAIKTVNARANTLSSAQVTQATTLRREVLHRKKEGATLKSDVKKARDFAMLQLLLNKPPKIFEKDGKTESELTVVDQNDFLLPLVLMGGMGGDGGGGLGGDNSMLMLLLLKEKK